MIENAISTDSFSSQAEFSTQGRFPMLTVTLCGIQMRMIITDQEHLLDSRSTWYCLTDLGEGVGSSNPKRLINLLKRKELDSKTFSNDEIILGNFKGNDSLPLANRGNTFVSLRCVLEILSKTELSSDKSTTTSTVLCAQLQSVHVTARDWCYNHKITVKINEPKWAVSAKLTKICEAHPDRDQWRRDARGTKLFPKWACDILDKVYDEDDTFLSEYRIV